MIKLRIIQPGRAPEDLTIDRDIAVVGRNDSCDVVIRQPYVSKRHARILRGTVVLDLGSSNGTFVHGERIQEATLVTDGRVNLGHDDVVLEVLSGTTVSRNRDQEDSEPSSGTLPAELAAPGEDRLRELEQRAQSSEDRARGCEREAGDLREQLREAQASRAHHEARCRELEAEKASWRGQLETATRDRDAHAQKAQDLTRQSEELRQQATCLQGELQLAQESAHRAQDRIEKIEDELARLRTEHQSTLAERDAARTEAEAARRGPMGAFALEDDRIAELERENAALRARLGPRS